MDSEEGVAAREGAIDAGLPGGAGEAAISPLSELTRPGGTVSARPLHFFWLADCSGSMSREGRIQALNNAVEEALPHMRRVASENPNVEVLVRVLRFASGAEWLQAAPTPLRSFVWPRLEAGGVTDLGAALGLLAAQLRAAAMPQRALSPVIVLLSDGRPTDDFGTGLRQLLDEPWGRRAVRLAVAIGRDADGDILRQFIDDPKVAPLVANSPEVLARQIRWASTVGLDTASAPRVGMVDREQGVVLSMPSPLGRSTQSAREIEIW
ncbi:MAG: tellurium resistance protein [Actinomycetota bacterium]|nr:tellurium resistance protein [Actinomycetota bacterium]